MARHLRCAELIIRTGIPRVVVATIDPNPKVGGRGIEMLRGCRGGGRDRDA